MKVCIVGNSHVGAIRRALNDGVKLSGGGDVFVAGIPLPYWSSGAVFKREGSCLVPASDRIRNKLSGDFEDAAKRIDLAGFDCFVIHGFGPNLYSFYTSFARFDMSEDDPDSAGERIVKRHISQACLKQCAEDYYAQNGALANNVFPVVDIVRSITDIPVVLSSRPFPVLSIKPTYSRKLRSHTRGVVSSVALHERLAQQALERLFPDRCQPIFWLDQPPKTVTKGIFTKNRFGADGSDEFGHMNARYGKHYLGHLEKFLTDLNGGAAEAGQSDGGETPDATADRGNGSGASPEAELVS